MSVDHQLVFACLCSGVQTPLAGNIAGKRNLFNSAMDSGFLESFQRRSLSVGHARLGVTFGKSPASAAARPNQQEFEAGAALTVAHGSHLFAVTQFAKV